MFYLAWFNTGYMTGALQYIIIINYYLLVFDCSMGSLGIGMKQVVLFLIY